eukprot:COSAG01_NODE_10552_length_2134_cov_2.139558_1_plen_388_part_10
MQVSNYRVRHIQELLSHPTLRVAPQVNQCEFSPVCQQRELRAFCAQHGIAWMAHTPFGGRGAPLLRDGRLHSLCTRLGLAPSQLLLSWAVRHCGAIVIPKTQSDVRMRENLAGALLVGSHFPPLSICLSCSRDRSDWDVPTSRMLLPRDSGPQTRGPWQSGAALDTAALQTLDAMDHASSVDASRQDAELAQQEGGCATAAAGAATTAGRTPHTHNAGGLASSSSSSSSSMEATALEHAADEGTTTAAAMDGLMAVVDAVVRPPESGGGRGGRLCSSSIRLFARPFRLGFALCHACVGHATHYKLGRHNEREETAGWSCGQAARGSRGCHPRRCLGTHARSSTSCACRQCNSQLRAELGLASILSALSLPLSLPGGHPEQNKEQSKTV